jgi:hypothetical protein
VTYALDLAVSNPRLAVAGGLLYAFLITIFNREVVSALSSSIVWYRAPVAVLFGFLVAIPLEIRLLQGPILEELQRQELEGNTRFAEERARILGQAEQLKEHHRAQLQRASSSTDAVTSRVQESRDALEQLEHEQLVVWKKMLGEEHGAPGDGLTGIRGQGKAWSYWRDLHAGLSDRVDKQRDELAQLTTRARQVEADANALSTQLEADLRRLDDQAASRVALAKQRLFVARSDDLLARYEALEAIKRSSPAAYWFGWLLRLLFVVIELLPAFIKLSASSCEYFWIVKAEQRKNATRTIALANLEMREIVSDAEGADADRVRRHFFAHPQSWDRAA